MILYVKSDIEPVYESWNWKYNDKIFSFRGIRRTLNLFNQWEQAEKKIKFKFLSDNTGLLIDFEDSKHDFFEYALYLGSEKYCTFEVTDYYNKKNLGEHFCDYFILKYSTDIFYEFNGKNFYYKYHVKGICDKFGKPVFFGLADIVTDSLYGIPFKTNLSANKVRRNFYALLSNDNKREKTLLLCNAEKIKNDFKEIEYIAKSMDFSYFAVSVDIYSKFTNKKNKLKTL